MNEQIVANKCLNFIFTDSLSHRFSYHTTPNALLQITKQLLLQVSTRSFLGTRTTVLNIVRVTRMLFSRWAQALQQFLCQKLRCWAIPEKYGRCRLFLCVSAIAVLYLATKQLYEFLLDFTAEQLHLWYVWLILVRKCFKRYTLSSSVRPSFLKCDLRFSSAPQSSAYLRLSC